MDLPRETLTVTFQVVTPLFLSGAEQDKAEIRLPSVKGALRYWYRAIQPQYNQLDKESTGASLEEQLFGGTGSGAGLGRFLLRDVSTEEVKQNIRRRFDPVFSKDLSYLSFSLRSKKLERDYIQPDQEFKIQLVLRPETNTERQKRNWQELMASIWLLGHVGGLGARSRRGFGSVQLSSWEAPPDSLAQQVLKELHIAHQQQTSQDWLKAFMHSLKVIHSWFVNYSESPTHTVINQQTGFYLASTGFAHWEKALAYGAKCIKEFREQKGIRRVALGLPMILPNKVIIQPKKREGNRVASPVWLRIVRIGKEFYPFFSVLSAPFPQIEKMDKGQSRNVHIHHQTVLEEFKNYLVEQGYSQGASL
ncbi:type III-B CRISPR module RAMP protein Cmr1 [Thermoflavimicrobium daqui]|uniref:type III-B CRISPR module RAMP protein Cmr1 n=1 Tax=Thermoflavimicrobium daqui TaxID=2137476 RepID=UPI00143DBA2A|nr:type III-B CRISPR module RAMP protein Cmr1 [Thermoflavimicrobium daqui]